MILEFAASYILSNEVQSRWERTLTLQKKLWPGWTSIKKVFVVDRTYSFYGTLHPIGDVIRIELFNAQRHILFSRAKNEGLRWAEHSGVDWVLDADADCVIVTPPGRCPETQYSSMLCHFQGKNESFDELERKASAGLLEARHFSRFLLGRGIFPQFRFDEEFHGYAGEDIDFHLNLIQRNGIRWSDSGMRGINLYHPLGARPGNIERLDRKSNGLL